MGQILPSYSVIGKSVPRKDALEKVLGQARYGVDLSLPGMLAARILRSTLPHARILNIDTTKAERLAGVKAVITAKDAPQVKRRLKTFWPESRILVSDKVRFLGEEVAAVAAVDEGMAEEALELIKVDYQELPALFDPEAALKPDAPRIHEQGNVAAHFDIVRGQPDEAFARAAHVFEDEFATQIQNQSYLEPVSSLAHQDASGRLALWVASMDPSGIREDLAEVLKLPASRVRVIQACVGGAFGGKISLQPLYPISALLAIKTGRPVKIVNTREEEFTASLPRLPARMKIKTALDKDGTILAKETRIVADNGAYIDRGPRILAQMIIGPDSLYRVANIKAQAWLAYTNKSPVGAFRGFGTTQMSFALETHLDRIAEKLGIDPLKLRLRNATQTGDISAHGWQIDSCALNDCMGKSTRAVGWKENRPQLKSGRGLGLACALYNVESRRSDGFNGSVALVKIAEDGRALVISGESEYGQGWNTVAAQIAAEELGIPYEDVDVVMPDTDITPYSLGPWALRVTVSGGNAVKLAAADARRQILDIAAQLLEASSTDLEIRDRKVQVRGSPARALPISQVAKTAIFRRQGSAITGKGVDEPPNTVRPNPDVLYGNLSRAYNFSAQVVETVVDRETGRARVLKVISAHDIGQCINRAAVEGQVEGGFAQGLGYALTEEILWEGGQILNPDFLNYRIPTSLDMPQIETIIIESPDPNTPYGAKSIGMLSTIPIAPALTNAIHHALGVKLNTIPIAPHQVLHALEKGEQG